MFTIASVMARVSSRFCCSVRPAYHWIVMFGIRGSLPRPRQPLDLTTTKAAHQVVVHHPGGLHERVADRRPDEGEAARLQLAAEAMRGVGGGGHLPRRAPAVLNGPAADVAPQP